MWQQLSPPRAPPAASSWHKKSPCASQQANTRATHVGSWTLYHGPFSLSIRAAGWGRFAVGSSSGEALSGCCDSRKAGEFGAENSRVRLRFVGVRHGLAEAGEAAFPPCSMMEHHHREKSLPRPRNRTKPRTKKEFPLRNAGHKKGFAPRSEKSRLFLWGFTRGVPQHCGESLPRTRAKLPERVREKKSKHHGLGVTGSSLPLYAGKVCETVGKKRAPPPSGCWGIVVETGGWKVFQLWRVLL